MVGLMNRFNHVSILNQNEMIRCGANSNHNTFSTCWLVHKATSHKDQFRQPACLVHYCITACVRFTWSSWNVCGRGLGKYPGANMIYRIHLWYCLMWIELFKVIYVGRLIVNLPTKVYSFYDLKCTVILETLNDLWYHLKSVFLKLTLICCLLNRIRPDFFTSWATTNLFREIKKNWE